ncbi:hypothetical protein FZC33_11335 [Labrys sp. KNU-23]|uniref:hypothetical protein n=1 Tax=Labrys sp. KNU-23 TaxID=2789216 RepID=UPI0011EBFC97|nr:hypothetical protein [Labrys sp. KNU-23]QEN86884.1 hypothetical protein FZC33_11335 [Labrys sp. KNU-23]
MPKYKVLRPLDAGSESFAIGAIRELSTADAAHLVRLNCLEEVAETEAEAGEAGDGGGKQEGEGLNKAEIDPDNKAEAAAPKNKKAGA